MYVCVCVCVFSESGRVVLFVIEKVGAASTDTSADKKLDAELSTQIQKLSDEIESCREDIQKIEKEKKLYADDLCHVVSEKTIVNSDTSQGMDFTQVMRICVTRRREKDE